MGDTAPIVDKETRDAVVRAFREAKCADQNAATCYLAAVGAWCAIHPDHDRAQAALRAVEIVLQSRLGMLMGRGNVDLWS